MDIKELIKQYQAEYENACDDLYYGYGYKFWRTHNNTIQDDEIAKAVWHAAVDKMSRMDEGKVVNNKPYFHSYYSEWDENGPWEDEDDITPGRTIRDKGEGTAKKHGFELSSNPSFYNDISDEEIRDRIEKNRELAKQVEKHNQRAKDNYTRGGLWGSKEQQLAAQERAANIRKRILKQKRREQSLSQNVNNINEQRVSEIVSNTIKKVLKEENGRYVRNQGDLFDYFYNYIERHFNEITDDISLKDEFGGMWPVTQDYIDFDMFNISEEEAFKLFQHAYGMVNDDMKNGAINETKTNKNMKQSAIKLNETQLKKIVAESVKNVIKEYGYITFGGEGTTKEELEIEIEIPLASVIQTYMKLHSGLGYDEGELNEEVTELKNQINWAVKESNQLGIKIDFKECFNAAIQNVRNVFEEDLQKAIPDVNNLITKLTSTI